MTPGPLLLTKEKLSGGLRLTFFPNLANTVAEVGKAKPYGTGWEARQAVKTLSQLQPLPPPPPPQAGLRTYTEQGAELPRRSQGRLLPFRDPGASPRPRLSSRQPREPRRPPRPSRESPTGAQVSSWPETTCAACGDLRFGRLHSPGFPPLWEAARRASGWPWEWERNAGAWTRRGRRGDVLPQTKRQVLERRAPRTSDLAIQGKGRPPAENPQRTKLREW
ncbi:uncharacterized protein LOC144365724 [Ictidomys tridecemlineatus]